MSELLATGRYRIERTLAHGGMAIVYLAHDDELGRPVAVKVLATHVAADDNARRRFLREAKHAARLSHPNVVRVYDAGTTDEGQPFIVMEYVAGETLAGRGPIGADDAVQLVRQACAGLEHAHRAGLVHRDVKPANLLLRDDGVLKVADFGIARAAEATRLTRHGTVLGTAAYLAPEQAAGEEVTVAADVYSLGAVLYELLTGRPPYELESLADLAAKQRDGTITPVRDLVPDVPEHVEAAVMHALAREPRFRPSSAAALADELGAGAETATQALPQRTVVTEEISPRRTHRSRRRWWVAAAIVLAAVAGLAAVFMLRTGGTPAPTPRQARIVPPPPASNPLQEAQNLSAWLRAHAAP